MPSKGGILLVGLACVDAVSEVPRFPQEDSQLLVSRMRWALGGNAANSAVVLRQLGSDVSLFAALAQDPATWPLVKAQLDMAQLHYAHSPLRPSESFPLSTAIVNTENGSRTILHHRSGITEPSADEFAALPLADFRWIHFEARNFDQTKRMMQIANQLEPRPRISVEVEKLYPGLEGLMSGADVVLVSKDFAKHHGWTHMTEAVLGVSERMADAGALVICAWGEQGAAALDPATKEVVTSVAFPPERVVDTLGAGDSFVAGTLDGLLRGQPLKDAITRGCRVAGAKVGHHGLQDIPLPVL